MSSRGSDTRAASLADEKMVRAAFFSPGSQSVIWPDRVSPYISTERTHILTAGESKGVGLSGFKRSFVQYFPVEVQELYLDWVWTLHAGPPGVPS